MRREEVMIKKQKTGTGIEKKVMLEILILTSISKRVLKNIDFTTQYFVISLNRWREESGKTRSNRRCERHKNGRHYYYYYYYYYYYNHYYYYYYVMEIKMGGGCRT